MILKKESQFKRKVINYTLLFVLIIPVIHITVLHKQNTKGAIREEEKNPNNLQNQKIIADKVTPKGQIHTNKENQKQIKHTIKEELNTPGKPPNTLVEELQTENIDQNPIKNNRIHQKKITEITYTERGPIAIDGNNNFTTTAGNLGWDGNGSAGNPIIITAYNITGTGSENLIGIQNTDLHFKINHSILHNGSIGINLNNVSNGLVDNVFAYNNTDIGFYLSSYNNNTLTSNTAYNNSNHGFFLKSSSNNNLLINNTAYNNSQYGFYLSSSRNNTLTSNTAYNNLYHGFHIYSSSNNSLTSNIAYNNSINGFILDSLSNNNSLMSNTAINNTENGFYFELSSNNTLSGNTAYNNTGNGFFLRTSSNNTMNYNIANNNYGNGFYFYRNS
ncbi:MAG: right-handed parallel beta-helix repeat-containing protein, partial [Candidatus Hodarchaeales archaeon]